MENIMNIFNRKGSHPAKAFLPIASLLIAFCLSGCMDYYGPLTGDIEALREDFYVISEAWSRPAQGAPSAIPEKGEELLENAEEPLNAASFPSDEEILERIEKERASNPWGETQSLSVATEWAGVEFKAAPDEISLENGMTLLLSTYRYRTGTVEALYRGEDYGLIVRRSGEAQGSEPSYEELEDFFSVREPDAASTGSYTQAVSEKPVCDRDQSIGGLTVRCIGDGETISLAYFELYGDRFLIASDIGKERRGLAPSELSQIIAGLR